MTTKKKHTRHKFTNLLEWINPPWREDDNQSHRRFSVKARCACGEIGQREATLTEVEDYLSNLKCVRCGHFGEDFHSKEQDCFNNLRKRIQDLEETVEKITDAFGSFKNKMKAATDYDY
jgi:archaellum component FlaC